MTKPEVLEAAKASGGEFRAKAWMTQDLKAANRLVREGCMERAGRDRYGWFVFKIKST